MAKLITGLFSPKAPKIQAAPPPPPEPAEPSDPEVGLAGDDEAALRRRRGKGQTILTGSGLLEESADLISRPKLGNS